MPATLRHTWSSVRRLRHAVRMPLLRGLRRVRWYRAAANLPSNEVVAPRDATRAGAREGIRVAMLTVPSSDAPERPLAPTPADDPTAQRLFAGLEEPPCGDPFVLWLEHGRVVGRGVAVLDARGRVVSEVTVHLTGALREHGVYRRFWLPTARRYAGTTAILASPGGNTYYHWLLDVLPRLELLRRAGVEPASLDRIAFNSVRGAFQQETLARLGVPLERVISTDAARHLRGERLVVPSFAAPSGFPPHWVLEFLARALPPAPPAAGDAPSPALLYVSRQGARMRRLHEPHAVERVLADAGFTTVFPERLSVAEQARLFHGARVVVGVHGSGLANLVFCRPGTTVVELFGPTSAPTYYWVLARRLGLRYAAVVGAPPAGRAGAEDFVLDADELRRTLDRVT